MNKLEHVIVSSKSFDDEEAYAIIASNITAINLILEEGGSYDQISAEALQSYFVDYYAAQVNNGNFSQFVYNSKWNRTLNKLVAEGLKNMGAVKQLEYFEAQSKFVEGMSADELSMYFDSQYFAENATRDSLNNSGYFQIYEEENLVNLNAQWLRQLPNLKVLSIEEMYKEIEILLGKSISRD